MTFVVVMVIIGVGVGCLYLGYSAGIRKSNLNHAKAQNTLLKQLSDAYTSTTTFINAAKHISFCRGGLEVASKYKYGLSKAKDSLIADAEVDEAGITLPDIHESNIRLIDQLLKYNESVTDQLSGHLEDELKKLESMQTKFNG